MPERQLLTSLSPPIRTSMDTWSRLQAIPPAPAARDSTRGSAKNGQRSWPSICAKMPAFPCGELWYPRAMERLIPWPTILTQRGAPGIVGSKSRSWSTRGCKKVHCKQVRCKQVHRPKLFARRNLDSSVIVRCLCFLPQAGIGSYEYRVHSTQRVGRRFYSRGSSY